MTPESAAKFKHRITSLASQYGTTTSGTTGQRHYFDDTALLNFALALLATKEAAPSPEQQGEK